MASGGAWLYGQVPQSQVLGIVTDTTGLAVPGATVILTNEATGVRSTMSTTSAGDYEFLYLDSGTYTLTVQKEGFETAVFTGNKVQVLEKRRVDVQLKVGQLTTKVEVTGAAAKVDTDTAAVGTIISNREMTDLPLNGREFSTLAPLMAGVQVVGTSGSSGIMAGGFFATLVRVNGGEGGSYGGGSNTYTYDGVDNGFTLIGGPAMNPSIDSIQEFRIDRSQLPAEFGRGSTLLEVATKGGGNKFHGTAWEYNRNNATEAGEYFTHQVEVLKRNQYGANLGGPIKKDKEFFFINWESQKLVSVSRQLGTVLTPKQRAGDLSEFLPQTVQDPFTGAVFPGNIIPTADLNPVSLSLINAYMPLPNLPGIASNYLSSFPVTDNWSQVVGRADYVVSDKDRVNLRVAGEPRSPLSAGLSADSEPTQVLSYYYTVGTAWQRNWTSNTLTELRFGIHREHENQQDVPRKQWANPNIVGMGDSVPGYMWMNPYWVHYAGWWFPSDYYMSSYDVVANVTHIHGSHTIKAGFERTTHGFANPVGPGPNKQEEGFNGQYSGIGVGDYLLGWPYYANTEGYGEFIPRVNGGDPSTALFAQDDWKIAPNVTLNLGLRWDLFAPETEKHDLRTTFDPKADLVVVAGNKILPDYVNQAFLTAYPGMFTTAAAMGLPLHSMIYEVKDNLSPRLGFAWRPWKDNKTVVRGGYGLFYMLRDQHEMERNEAASPYQCCVGSMVNTIPHPTYTIQNPFAGASGGVGLISESIFNPYMLDPYTQQINFGIQREVPWGVVAEANFQDQHTIRWDNYLNLNSSPLGVSAMPYPKLSSYLFWNTTDNSYRYDALELILRKSSQHYTFEFNYTWAKNLCSGIPDEFVGNIYRGPGNYIPTEAKINFVLDLPVGRGRRFLNHGGVADAIIGGWEASSFTILHQGGNPLTVADNGLIDTNSQGTIAGRPNQVCNPRLSNPTTAEWFNTSCFVAEAPNTYGNAGSGDFFGPGRGMLTDFGMFKNFTLHEQLKLQFRAEMFNAFNHPYLNDPGTTWGAPASFGIIIGKSLTPRVFQFALRLSF